MEKIYVEKNAFCSRDYSSKKLPRNNYMSMTQKVPQHIVINLHHRILDKSPQKKKVHTCFHGRMFSIVLGEDTFQRSVHGV